MDAAQTQHQQSHLPSPPPSPPTARRRPRKKPADPFLELGDAATPIPSPLASPSQEPLEQQDALLTRIVLTPLLFTSFLLSLFLVNRSDRARRTSNSRSGTFLSYFSPSAWLDPEPYQDPVAATWARRGSTSHVEPHSAISPREDNDTQRKGKTRSWHLHKKIRRMARLEVTDAFEMRGRVLAVVLAVLLWAVVGAWWAVGWIMGRLWR